MKKDISVLLVLTGGTISMGENPATGALAPLDKERIFGYLPELQQLPVNISTVSFDPMIDSSDVNPEFWMKIVEVVRDNYERFDGFVILHGTDTMAYSASAVSFMLRNLAKPVIFTGSQLPLGVLRSDAKGNVMNAIEIAAAHDEQGNPLVPEVSIFFEAFLMRGNRTTKRSTDNFNAFRSYNGPDLAKVGVHIKYNTADILRPNAEKPLVVNEKLDDRVLVLTLTPGLRREMVETMFNAPGLRGVVLRSFGSGNAPTVEWLYQVLKQAGDRGIVTVNISQCATGAVEMGRYDTSINLQKAGVVSGYDMTLEAAVTKLMHLLGNYDDPQEVRQKFQESFCGEVTLPEKG